MYEQWLSREQYEQNLQQESEADELLKASGEIHYRGSTWTASQLERKIRLERRFFPIMPVTESYFNEGSIDVIFEPLANKAKLTPLQKKVFKLRLYGFTRVQIKIIMRMSRLRVYRIIRQSRRKLAKAWLQDPYSGWYGVYLNEVNRR